jgi:hypothetical protein
MTSPDRRSRVFRRLAEWARRYVPLEILSTLTALAGAGAASLLTTNAVAIAYAGAWSENVGYYGYAFVREMARAKRANTAANDEVPPSRRARMFGAVRALLWEFGVAEVLDSFLIRPLCMYAAVRLLGSLGLGIVLGKLAADVVFYAIAVTFYELGKKRRGERA